MVSLAAKGAPPPVATPPPPPPVEPFADFTVDVEDDDTEPWNEDARAASPGRSDGQTTTSGGFLASGDALRDADGAVDEIDEEKAAAKAAAKREKEIKKAIKDYMKTSLSRYDLQRVCCWCTKRATLACLMEHPRLANTPDTDWTSGGI